MPDEPTEQEIRRELGAILDRMASLPSEAFQERGVLLARQAELRDLLKTLSIDYDEGIKARWSERASNRPDDRDGVKPVIVSPNESGAF